ANLQLETGVIDSAIAEVKNWNRSHTNKLGIKLRVFAGIYTPQWVKDDVGSTTLDFEDSDFDGSYPHYWTQEYRTRYAQLHHALATKYDSVGVIKEVAISGCMIKNADMNRSPNEWQNINRLIDDGLTWQKDKGCQQWQIDTVASKWDRTKVAVARPHFRKFVKVTSQPSDTEWPISKTIMQEMVDTCRAHGNCIIGENSLERWDMEHNAFTDPFHPIYYVCGKYLENYEPKAPVYFQTGAFVDDNGTLTHQVLYWAIQNCGDSILKMIELPQLKKFNQYDVKYANDNNVAKTSYLGSDKMQSKRDKLKQ
ncbi:hypothetical protein, partial [Shewanella sp. GXUN23E]|uniref:hypothetical protein n=1 Tax=Shewanella sp. GXUN23E TaxID=3422498 RepID=UPI003D7EE0B2